MTKVILDCDPGHDDAVAILLAAGDPAIDLVAITTVAGNQTLENTTANACAICTIGGIDVPILAGADRPLLRNLRTAPEIHGASGLGGTTPIDPTVVPGDEHAVDFIVRHLREASEKTTLVAVGPLTNLALAVRREPTITEAVAQVVVMGGAFGRGNVTPAAEFNIAVDPESAEIVFGAPWRVTMVGLDLTHQALCTRDVQDRFVGLGTPLGDFVDGLMDFFRAGYAQEMPDPPVHDPCAVAYVIDPTVLEVVPATIEIETVGRYTSGMTVVDFVGSADSRQRVATVLDAGRFWEMVERSVARLGTTTQR